VTTLATKPGITQDRGSGTRADLRSENGVASILAYGAARSTITGTPLSPEELERTDAYWRASLYLCLGMLYLQKNPLLREPLKNEHVKPRLLGHWGSDAGQAFTYIHFNRLIKKYDLLIPQSEHPHGLSDCEFESLFTPDRPVIFAFHGYPWLIHRLTYRRPSQHNLHVRGYKEQGNINTPLELAIENQTDRFTLAIDAIERIPRLRVTAAAVRDDLVNERIACQQYAFQHGIDRLDITGWKWPF
jgi:phosphoketolase